MTKKALIIIDMQNDFVLPDSPSKVNGAYVTIPKIKQALDWFRNQKLPVFHVVREYRADGSDIEGVRLDNFINKQPCVVPNTEGCKIVAELSPVQGEYRVVKPRFSAFMGTELDFMLRRLKVDEVVICGTQYPNCIRASVYDAISYDYPATVLTDATSAATPEVAKANIIDMQNVGTNCITVDEFIS